jgi:hypothetical protein
MSVSRVREFTGGLSADMKNCPLGDMKVPTRGQ